MRDGNPTLVFAPGPYVSVGDIFSDSAADRQVNLLDAELYKEMRGAWVPGQVHTIAILTPWHKWDLAKHWLGTSGPEESPVFPCKKFQYI